MDLGVHAVDLMWWVMGRPEPVSAYGATFGELGRRGRGMGGWGIGYGPGKFSVSDDCYKEITESLTRHRGLLSGRPAPTLGCS